MGDQLPSAGDLATCASVLRALSPKDLQLPEVKEVLEAGALLFRRHILKEKFGDKDALEFLKEKHEINRKLGDLSKLHAVVTGTKARRRRAAEVCGINQARKAELAQVLEEAGKQITEDCREARLIKITDGDTKSGTDGADENTKRETVDEPDEAVGTQTESGYILKSPLPNLGDLRSYCNQCRGEISEHHHFYHQLCLLCGALNWEKREQTADMTGMVCVVTGGRVRIGYQIVLKLLRAGAFVLTTTRFPSDCALRYSKEADFESWRERLEVCGPLELSDMRLVERWCDQLAMRFPRIHVLINNAAQTLTRRDGWEVRMANLEYSATTALPAIAQGLLRRPAQLAAPPESRSLTDAAGNSAVVPAPAPSCDETVWLEAVQDFPEGQLDESRQPLDLSPVNSWSRGLGEIPTLELLQTLAANTAAPFIMCSRLASNLAAPSENDPFGHIINVSAMEGKFNAKFKSAGHPHTNMAKAALNMLTMTSAPELFRRRVLMNCVDTGWVTDMAPRGVGNVAASRETFVAPPLDEIDGAARCLDPIFSHLKDASWLVRGKFFKNYYISQW
eukprot:TRINITY_DN58473_c0_g1_i1.p1 TRINITY_DN58473_c0_g1~~TRINITY_DN58473_c0_g1_i1.p1  ORF type:complete len:564 (-),score=94.61 TRINITY_DN58473_c0_g1_i1:218-1909(-)